MQLGKAIVRFAVLLFILVLSIGASFASNARSKYSVGASDREIVIGNFAPYSGPVSAFGVVGKVNGAYFKMLNEKGGINGRRIRWLSYDDAYNPAKALEQTRKLVEGDEVLLLTQTVGTPSNTAVLNYLNQKKVPHLLVATGGTRFGNDPAAFPWTMPFNVPYQVEGRIYAKWIIENRPEARIGILAPNDDYGKDILKGVKDGLGSHLSMVVAETIYDSSDPTIDGQIFRMKSSGVDLFLNLATPKFAAMAIRRIGELGWKPFQILNQVSQSTGAVMLPAGVEHAQGILSAAYIKDPSSPEWQTDESMREYLVFLERYAPEVDRNNSLALYAYSAAQTLEHILTTAENNLTRENIMRIVRNLNGYAPTALLPGIRMNTASDDYFPIKQMRMMQFRGSSWEFVGPNLDATLN